jgi:hypothetical protein
MFNDDNQQSNQTFQSQTNDDTSSEPQSTLSAPPDSLSNPTFTPLDGDATTATDNADDTTTDDSSDSTSTDPAATTDQSPVSEPDDLSEIKKRALDELSPLVSKLDQSPEEKFKTLMMMIQASDNRDLIQPAYEAAQAITDEKAKAEALLNIVNEINYLSQQKTS